jgi:hypothetical protein
MLPASQLGAFGIGISAFIVIVSGHILSLHAVAGMVQRLPRGHLQGAAFIRDALFVLPVLALFVSLHLTTNLLWGVVIEAVGAVRTYRDAVFFSLENYTSLGLTRVQVDEIWRTLAPLISLSGVFCLGWSTAVLITLFSHVYWSRDA